MSELETPEPLDETHELLTYRTMLVRVDVTESLMGDLRGISCRFEWFDEDATERCNWYQQKYPLPSRWASLERVVHSWAVGGEPAARRAATHHGMTVTRH